MRLWLVASVLWVVGATWFTYENVLGACEPPEEHIQHGVWEVECEASMSVSGHLDRLSAHPRRYVSQYVAVAFLPIFAVLAMGITVSWIAVGFKARKTPACFY